MSVSGVAGFWSYSHDDDERDGHGLLRLAARIRDEFALVTGESLTLFVDRNDITWGDEWRRRIDTALAETTFFIPIITPLYFKRDECRRELVSFVGQAESLGAIELVMPILYVDVPELAEDGTDEVRALIARMQYVDWRKLRLSAEDSPEYRQGVNSLAAKLAEVGNRYEHSESQQLLGAQDESDQEGLLDLLAPLEDKFPQWLEILDDAEAADRQLDAIIDPYNDRLKKLGPTPASGPLLNHIRSVVRDVEPIVRRILEDTKNFSTSCIELDPLVLRILRKLEFFSEPIPIITRGLNPIEVAARRIEEYDKEFSYSEYISAYAKYKGLSKDLARLMRLVEAVARYRNDATSLVTNWHEEIQKYMKPPGHAATPDTRK